MFESQGPRKKILLALAPRSKRQPWQWVFQSKIDWNPLFVFAMGSNYQEYFTWNEYCVPTQIGCESGLWIRSHIFAWKEFLCEMILIDLAENLRCSFVFLFTIFINCVWFLFICQLGLISFHLSTGADIYCIKCYGGNQWGRNHFFRLPFAFCQGNK